MWDWITLSSVSKAVALAWLFRAEIALLAFAALLVVGLTGELIEQWRSWHNIFAIAVIIGVAGELIADGFIFVYSSRLQEIQDGENAVLHDRAATAELALAKLKAPRKITNEAELVTWLRQQKGTFWIITERNDQDAGSEQMLLSGQLRRIFIAADWRNNNHLSIDQSVAEPEFAPVSDRGCNLVTAGDAESLALREFVFESLKSVDLDCFQNVAPTFLPKSLVIEIGLR